MKLTSHMPWMYCYVYDSSGNEIFKETPFWNINIKQVTESYKIYLNPGTYYIAMEQGSGTGKYNFSLTPNYLNNIDLSYDNTLSSAHGIALTSNFTGVLAQDDVLISIN